jgi:hypothetical protein
MVAFVVATPLPAFAASFEFSYAFSSGKLLQGTFDGTQFEDTIYSISSVMATYNSTLVVATDGGGSASFSGSLLQFSGYMPGVLLANFRIGSLSKGLPQPQISYARVLGNCNDPSGCSVLENEIANPSSWSVRVSGSAPVPEPTAVTLFVFGALILGAHGRVANSSGFFANDR